MRKILFLVLFLAFLFPQDVFAEKVAVKIAPIQVISTHHDEIEIGDWIDFEVVSDVYKDDKLFLKKGTKIIGIVDFVHPNGWLADGAVINIKNFTTVDINKKKVEIAYPVSINGNKFLENDAKQYLAYVRSSLLFRGSEIYIEPDTQTFNLFVDL